MANLRSAQKEMTRQLLLDTALSSFAAKGFAATTVADIAGAAGATHTTFYLHFTSKTELMRALLDELTASGIPADPRELKRLVREGDRVELAHWLRRVSESWQYLRPYLDAADEAAALDPDLRLAVEAWPSVAIDEIAAGLDEAGRFEPDTRRIRAALAFSELDYLSRRWMRDGWDLPREPLVELLARSWTKLLAESVSERPR